MNIKSGIKLLEEEVGSGLLAEREENMMKLHPELLNIQEGFAFINFNLRLGRRYVCAGVEYSLYGMREGRYRKVKVSPHLAYGEEGIPEKVPPNAVLIFQIWLRKVVKKSNPSNAPPA